MIEYILIRSKRKTTVLYVKNGGLEVRAPLKMPMRDINRFIAFKEQWIIDKLRQSNERLEQRERFILAYGGFVTYRGKPYPIAVKDGNQVGFDDKGFLIPL